MSKRVRDHMCTVDHAICDRHLGLVALNNVAEFCGNDQSVCSVFHGFRGSNYAERSRRRPSC